MLKSKTKEDMLQHVENIINTVRDPLITLDQNLRVITVNRSFYTFFKAKPENTIGQLIYELNDKQWDIPLLRELLKKILPQKTSFDDYLVERDFAVIGRRIMRLNARQVEGKGRIILLVMEDITERADELVIANQEKDKQANKLVIANQERERRADKLVTVSEEKSKLTDELVIANQEKDKRLDKLVIANKEKGKRADELVIANKEKDKRADELVIANQEKDKRADELVIANQEKDKRANELVIANEEKDRRADKLVIANKEKDKRADELVIANQEKVKRANELVIANQKKELLVRKLKRAASVFSHADESIMITDASATITEVNGSFSRNTGYTPDEVLGKNPKILQSGRHSSAFYAEMWATLLAKGYWRGEIWNRRKNGEIYPVMLTVNAVKDTSGVVQHYVSLSTDITSMKAYQGQLERIAHYDSLTNLPNRVLLADHLKHDMLQCQRNNLTLAVAFLDLDDFKEVNDNHGHNLGDELLITVSQRMQKALREGDTLARIGGDEFIVVIADLQNVENSTPILESLLKAASDPVTVGDVEIQVSASIGVTLYPQDGSDADQLMRHADQAMYSAKQAGKNCFRLFDTVLANASKVQLESIDNIISALKQHEFVLHYQPKVNMNTGAVIGVEALIRWQHPERGLVPPLEFLPIIEGHTISLELGEWVIGTALEQIKQWQTIGMHLPISVNISGYQLQQGNFATRIAALLAAYPEVNPSYLELEILETSVLHDISQVSATMNACHKLGVRFALDDFGTGYSSLTHLRRLPAQLIKIDQTFVRDMLEDADDCAIVEGVIGLAKAFRRDVIAEGVETIAHGVALLQLGCELAQGYGIARPMLGTNIPQWISNWKADESW
jgi:diguanylate cyclase (GGDEF)-like protein/PAS domain S-box-containing protein